MAGDPSGTGGPPRLRPTVVAGPASRPAKPAAAPGDPRPRPTAPPSGPPPRAPETKAMGAAPAFGAAQSARPLAPPVLPRGPTAIRGTAPRRPEAGPADLQRRAPQVSPEVVERALALLRGVNLDAFGERQAALWGQDLQAEHAGLVSGALDLSQSEALHRAAAHLGRLTTLLGSIDVEAAVGTAAPGLLGRLVRSGNAAVDAPEELAAARAEIDQLLGLLAEAMPRLLTLREAIERHWRRIESAGDEALALALAAEALAEEVRPERPDLARRLDERAMSLTYTLAQVRGAASLREAQAEQPLRLVAAIQDVALVQLPGWLASVMAFAAAGARPATATQAGELAHRLRSIAQNLNP